jgi:hypothetical protein
MAIDEVPPRLRISVFVAPRLRSTAQEGDRLGLWPDGKHSPAVGSCCGA